MRHPVLSCDHAPQFGSNRRRRLVPVASLMLMLAVAGCTSSDDLSDTLASLNPMGDNKKKLPGERKSILAADGQTQIVTKGKTVVVPPARSGVPWSQASGPIGNNPGNVALSGTAGNRIWATAAAEVGAAGFGTESVRVFSRPVEADGRIFVYDPNGNVAAHSAENGGRIWRVNLKPEGVSAVTPGGGVAVEGGKVFVSTGYGVVAALDASSGAVLWSKKLDHPGRGAPTAADGKLFLVSQGNLLYALNAGDGSEIWTFKGVPESGGLLGSANPAVANGFVIVPFSSGELVAVDIKSGNGAWTQQMARGSRNYAITGLTDITASPVVDDGVVYASGVGNRTAAFQLKTGAQLWEVPVGSAYTPAVAGNAVFVVDLDDNLMAIDRKTGEVIWTSKLPVTRAKHRATHWAGPVLAGGSLWLASNEGGLLAIDPTSGRVVVTRDGNDVTVSSPAVMQGRLVTLSANGTLAAFD